MAFELQAVDAVLATVCAMLSDETHVLREKMVGIHDELRGDSSSSPGDNLQEQLRVLKDSIGEMEGRVQGVVRALNLILDDDEDMALMNLSRLISHPERFLQPVSQDVLGEESDEPELILEAYLQQVLCESNVLELLKGNISSTEGLVNVKLDAIRNRLLYINTMIAVFTLSVTVETVVGSFFGANLDNHLMESPTAWWNITL
jgi:magnesium transporter